MDCENTQEAGPNGAQHLGHGGGRWPVWKRTMAGALVEGRHSGPGKLVLIDVKRAEAGLTLQETRATEPMKSERSVRGRLGQLVARSIRPSTSDIGGTISELHHRSRNRNDEKGSKRHRSWRAASTASLPGVEDPQGNSTTQPIRGLYSSISVVGIGRASGELGNRTVLRVRVSNDGCRSW